MKKLLIVLFITTILLTTLVLTVSAATYKYTGNTTFSPNLSVKDPKSEERPVMTKMFQFLNNSDGKTYYGYCLDSTVLLDHNNPYTDFPTRAQELAILDNTPSPSTSEEKYNQLLMLANYQMYGNHYIDSAYDINSTLYKTLSTQNIQMTVWKITFGNHVMFYSPNTKSERLADPVDSTFYIRKFTQDFFDKYLSGEISNNFNQMKANINSTIVTITGSANVYKSNDENDVFGPFRVTVNNNLLNNQLFALEISDSAVAPYATFVDANENTITSVLPNTDFYVKLSQDSPVYKFGFTAKLIDFLYGYDIKILTCTVPGKQPVVIYIPLLKSFCASKCVSNNIKFLGDTAWAGFMTSKEFPKYKKGANNSYTEGLKTAYRTGASAWAMAVKFEGESVTYDFIAGQYTKVGTVLIEKIDNTSLRVKVTMFNGYDFHEIKCGAYATLAEIPGAPGHLMQRSTTTSIFTLPYNGGTMYVSVHGDV